MKIFENALSRLSKSGAAGGKRASASLPLTAVLPSGGRETPSPLREAREAVFEAEDEADRLSRRLEQENRRYSGWLSLGR